MLDGQKDKINPLKPSGHCMYRQLTFNSSTLCPHSVLCSLYGNHLVVLITEEATIIQPNTTKFYFNSTQKPYKGRSFVRLLC